MQKKEVETTIVLGTVVECTIATSEKIKESILQEGGTIIYQTSILKSSGKLMIEKNIF